MHFVKQEYFADNNALHMHRYNKRTITMKNEMRNNEKGVATHRMHLMRNILFVSQNIHCIKGFSIILLGSAFVGSCISMTFHKVFNNDNGIKNPGTP